MICILLVRGDLMSEVKIIRATINNKSKKDKFKPIKKRVCAYARVSTDEIEQLSSYKSQILYYSTLIKNNLEWDYVGVYADEGISGTQVKNRNEFKRMIDDALNGRIDMIISKSISRFARNTLDTLKYVRLLREKNVDVYFEKENIHTLELDSEMFLTLYSAFAQAESESISMNVKMGFRAKMKRGEACGTIACYGYNWDSYNKQLSINEAEARVVIKIFKWYIDGYGSSKICKKLEEQSILSAEGGKKWHPSAIKYILKNEKYVGDLCGQKYYVLSPLNHRSIINRGEKDKYYVYNHHIPIISREIFQKAQEIYNKRSIQIKDGKKYCEKFSLRYPLSSRVFCGNCGNVYVRRVMHHQNKFKEKINYVYWVCSCNKYKKGYCDKNLSVKEIDIENLFVEFFKKIQPKDNNINNLLEKISKSLFTNSSQKEIKKIEKCEKEINTKISKLIDLKLQNNLGVELFNDKYNELKSELKILKLKKKNIMLNDKSKEEKKEQIKNIENGLKKFEISKFNVDIFKRLVKKVTIGGYNENGEYKKNMVRFILNSK